MVYLRHVAIKRDDGTWNNNWREYYFYILQEKNWLSDKPIHHERSKDHSGIWMWVEFRFSICLFVNLKMVEILVQQNWIFQYIIHFSLFKTAFNINYNWSQALGMHAYEPRIQLAGHYIRNRPLLISKQVKQSFFVNVSRIADEEQRYFHVSKCTN